MAKEKLVKPVDGMEIREDTRFAQGTYIVPNGITIANGGVALDGNGAVLFGSGRKGSGVRIIGQKGVSVSNLHLREYFHGIRAEECTNLAIRDCGITSTNEVAPNTIFLDIWLGPEISYGGGIMLNKCADTVIENNDLQHQQSGLLTYFCSRLTVRNNQANYNSGYGLHLFETCDSLFEGNSVDYCCRFEPREGGLHYGHMGADATGFLVIHNSCRNSFIRNTARLGGDGFFLAGFSPDGRKVGCNDNLFVENDASLSPNIGFEATFCSGNVFRNNYADRCNYGFWLGFSWDTTVENNRVVMNRQAGIAVGNGHGNRVHGNNFLANGHGILLWSHYVESFATQFPESLTSYDWLIEGNTFTRNGKGIRIAADQDHGIRPEPEDRCGRPELTPHDHTIRKNDIQDNRVGIELYKTDKTVIEENILNRNVEANLRQEDCEGTMVRDNLGSTGGYL